MSETVLYAEAKMGKLLKDIPPARGVGSGGGKKGKMSLAPNGGSKSTELQKTGIKHSDRSRARILADNKDAIIEVVEEALASAVSIFAQLIQFSSVVLRAVPKEPPILSVSGLP